LSQATPAAIALPTQTAPVRGHAVDVLRTVVFLLVAALAILVLLPAALAAQVAFSG
jgi:hypothetical protein